MFRALVVLLACLAALQAEAACRTSNWVAEYRSTPPLLAHQSDASLVVTVHADGCLAVRYPSHDMRRGSYARNLAAAAHEQLLGELLGSGVLELDARLLRSSIDIQRAKRATPGTTLYQVTDENLIEFRFAGKGKAAARTLRWATLEQDLMNLPDHPDLLAIAALRATFTDLAELARPASTEGQQP